MFTRTALAILCFVLLLWTYMYFMTFLGTGPIGIHASEALPFSTTGIPYCIKMNIPTEPYTEFQNDIEFDHESENLSAMELYERYHSKLPIIIRVTIGNYSDVDIETFGSGQMFWVAKVSKQKRVIARDKDGRYLTLPVNIPVNFRVVKGYKKVGEIQTLPEILEQNNIPVQVQFAAKTETDSFRVGANDTTLRQFGNIVLTEVYDEKYFLVNPFNCAVLYPKYMLIPVYLKEVTFARVTSVRHGNKQDWKNLLIGLNKASKDFKYDVTDGNKDIAVLPEDCTQVTSDNIYDYIDSKSFLYSSKKTGRKSDHPADGVYVDIRLESGKSKSTPVPPKLPARNLAPRKTSIPSSMSPTKSPTSPSGGKFPSAVGDSESSAGSVKSLSDLGDFVRGYSIAEIGESLKELQLSKYIKPLRDAQVDGAFLLELDAETLKEDFNMKRSEAKKLMLFAHTGHIPS